MVSCGGLVRFQYMWNYKIMPPSNFNVNQSRASIERFAGLPAGHRAKHWIGHDKEAGVNRAPRFFE